MKKFNSNYLRKIFGIGILISACNSGAAQITNGSFESHSSAVHYLQVNNNWLQNRFASDWTTPSYGTPDLFVSSNSACGSAGNSGDNPNQFVCYPQACITENAFGQQYPHSGSKYAGFECGLEYIQNLNAFNLVAGQCYRLVFYVSRGDMAIRASKIQAVFSHGNAMNDPTLLGPLDYTLDPSAIVLTSDAGNTTPSTEYIMSKTSWTKVTFNFKATGGESYLTIGVFDVNGVIDPGDPTGNTLMPVYINDNSQGDCGYTDQNNVYHPCATCDANDPAYYYIDDVSLTATSGGSFTPNVTFTSASTGVSGSIGTPANPQNIMFSGIVTLSGNLTLTNCDVRCNSGTKIIVPAGKTLYIVNSHLQSGCDNMWDGIVVQTGGAIRINSGSLIEDALTAVSLDGGSWQILNSAFNKNVNDLYFTNVSIGSGYLMQGVIFDHTQTLKQPSLTPAGKGLCGITLAGMSGTSNPFEIGGPDMADICQFLGGDYGIKSDNANVTVERCLFSNIKQVAIDFEGNHPGNALRTLTVKGASTFVSNKRAILSQHKTNLTVQGCYFYYAQEHAIEWDDNHDGHLLIGDTADAMKGNTFHDNAWTCVTAWDNKTAQTDPLTLATNATNLYTSIVIANNTITAPAAAGGFLIGEWTLGSTVPYHTLDVSFNAMNNVVKGIQMYNIRGWGGAFSSTNTPSNLPAQHVWGNTIGITTAVTASPFGIKIGNAPGYRVEVNEITSDAPGTWQNIGIEFESSPFSKIFMNYLHTGNGIAVRQDMLNSNIHCNIMDENATGLFMDGTVLRAVNSYHGIQTYDGYYNTINTANPWQHGILVLNCDLLKNQWIWTADPLPTMWYQNSPGTLFQTVYGDNNCDIPIYRYPYVQNGPNIDMSFSDANEQWKADYNYEITRLHTDSGSSAVASANIKSIIAIEDHIGAKNYTAAQTALTALTPANAFEENFKEVMTVFVALNYPQQREPATGEMITLTDIAAQYSRNAGPAVTLARTYLAVKYNMYFADEVPFLDTTVHGTTVVSSPCSIAPVSGTQLSFMDADGNDLPMYATIEANGNFAFDPFQLAYYNYTQPSDEFRIYAKHGSAFTVVSRDFNTIAEWIALSPVNFDLAGTVVEIDTITTVEYEGIDHYTSVEDKEGNVYSVGATSGASTDFLIEKRTSGNDLSWSRTYDGPTSGSDTATCITIDGENNIYVAGKVFNGMSYDFEVLKYNPDGVLIWESYLADSLKKNNTPTGISIHGSGSVSITGTCINDTSSEFRFVKLWQCLPFAERTGNANEETETIQTSSSVEFYPNPATGKITIALGDQSGGTLELFSLEGRLIFTKQISQPGEVVFPESQVANGVYLLKFSGSGQPQFSKLIIQHNQ